MAEPGAAAEAAAPTEEEAGARYDMFGDEPILLAAAPEAAAQYDMFGDEPETSPQEAAGVIAAKHRIEGECDDEGMLPAAVAA